MFIRIDPNVTVDGGEETGHATGEPNVDRANQQVIQTWHKQNALHCIQKKGGKDNLLVL